MFLSYNRILARHSAGILRCFVSNCSPLFFHTLEKNQLTALQRKQDFQAITKAYIFKYHLRTNSNQFKLAFHEYFSTG